MTRKDSKELDAQRSRMLSCPNPKQENQLILGMRWRTHYLHCHPIHVCFDVVINGVSYLLHQGQAIHVILSFKMDNIFHSHLEGIAWHEVVWILYKRVAWFWSSYTRPGAWLALQVLLFFFFQKQYSAEVVIGYSIRSHWLEESKHNISSHYFKSDDHLQEKPAGQLALLWFQTILLVVFCSTIFWHNFLP